MMFEVPDNAWLTTFMGNPPDEAQPHEGFWAYSVADSSGVVLRLSYHIFEKRVSVALERNELELVDFTHEDAVRMWTEEEQGRKVIACEFGDPDTVAKLEIELAPRIRIRMVSLKVE